jgi:hypothetical protein
VDRLSTDASCVPAGQNSPASGVCRKQRVLHDTAAAAAATAVEVVEMGSSAQADRLSTDASCVPAGQNPPASGVCRKQWVLQEVYVSRLMSTAKH